MNLEDILSQLTLVSMDIIKWQRKFLFESNVEFTLAQDAAVCACVCVRVCVCVLSDLYVSTSNSLMMFILLRSRRTLEKVVTPAAV